MRKITQKKNALNLVLNSLKPHASDPTLLECKFIILDFEKSLNNVIVTEDVATGTLAKSIINKPIRGHYKEDEEDFGGHEAYIKENKNGEKVFERNTIPMGVFTSEGYIEEIDVIGGKKKVLVADAVLWWSQFKQPIDLLIEWFNEGLTIAMSCEYLYSNYEVIEGVEYHKSPLYLEAHCLLGKDVAPAYESAKLIDYNQLNQFKQLVAQAIEQEREKEEVNLAEEVKDENLELNEEEVETETSTEQETQVQTNEVSHDDIRSQIREQVKAHILGESYVWVADVYETYTVVEVEFNDGNDYTWKHYKFNYSIENEVVTVDLSTQEEVKAKREWVVVTNELQEELNKVTSEKAELEVKFNEATETIISLNSTIDELKPYQELALNAKREEKLGELKDKFSKAFNNAGAKDKFESEEVQTLLNEAVESTDALLQLNTMVVDLVTELQVKDNSAPALLGLNSSRKQLLVDTEDEFDKIFKI